MNGAKRGAMGLVALAVLPGMLLASDEVTELRFKLSRGYTVVAPGSIGKMNKLNFLTDTGAASSVVDRRIVNKLRLVGKQESLSVFNRNVPARRVVLPELELGPIRVKGLEVLAGDLSFVEDGLGVHIDAMIGLDVLSRSSFSIDYKSKRLAFGPSELTGSVVSFLQGPSLAVVLLKVGGEPVRLPVDAGAKDLILFGGRVRGRLAKVPSGIKKASSNMGGEVGPTAVKLGDAGLGSLSLGNQRAYVLNTEGQSLPGFDGLLEIRSLGVKRVAFDFERNMISWLCPDFSGGTQRRLPTCVSASRSRRANRETIKLGERARAIASQRRAFAQHPEKRTLLFIDPAMDSLRSAARFQELAGSGDTPSQC